MSLRLTKPKSSTRVSSGGPEVGAALGDAGRASGSATASVAPATASVAETPGPGPLPQPVKGSTRITPAAGSTAKRRNMSPDVNVFPTLSADLSARMDSDIAKQ